MINIKKQAPFIKNADLLEIEWDGPFSWPNFESYNGLSSIPDKSGIYLKCFEYKFGYIIYSVGISRRLIPIRLKEHTREYLKGSYNLFDMSLMAEGIRQSLWQGWRWTEEKKILFEKNRIKIQDLARLQLSKLSVFIAEVSLEERFLERLEAKVMNSLYNSGYPYSEIPDKGMFLSPRRDDEESICVKNNCKKAIFGMPNAFEI